MRPIQLMMQAFGPFAQTQCIDFTKLGKTPFFLINGPTGAGKSAILDAICYALYGETTGSERAGEQMRCDFSPVDCETRLEFEFELGQTMYRVVRTPEQMVPKKRGEGETRQTHFARLYQRDGSEQWQPLTEKTGEVAQYVSERIGLSVRQFRQVMVIPQGQFRDLLLANSRDREQILGQLFDTQMYLDIERVLAEKAAEIRREKGDFDQQIKGSLDIAGVANEEELTELLQHTAESLNTRQADYQQARRQFDEMHAEQVRQQTLLSRFTELDGHRRALAEQQSRADEMAKCQQRYQAAINADEISHSYLQVQSLKQRLSVSHTSLAEKQSALADARHRFDEARQAGESVATGAETVVRHKETLFHLQQQLSECTRLQHAEQALNEVSRRYQACQQHQQQEEAALNQNRLAAEQLTQQWQHLCQEQSQLEALRYQARDLNAYLTNLRSLADLSEQQTALTHQVEKLNARLTSDRQSEQQALDSLRRTEMNWHQNQAAELALLLDEQSPCPVCGSVSHPHPATYRGEVVTKDDVELARTTYLQSQTVSQETERGRNDRQFALQATQQQISVLQQSDIVLKYQALSGEDAHSQWLDTQSAIARIEAMEPDRVRQQVEALNARIAAQAQALDELKGQTDAAYKAWVTAQSEVAGLRNTLPEGRTQSIIEQEMANIQQQITAIETRNRQLTDNLNHWDKQVSVLIAGVAEYDTQRQRLEGEYDQAREQWQVALKDSAFDSDDAYLAACLPKSQRSELSQQIQAYHEKLAVLTAQISALETALAGKEKPDLTQTETQRSEAKSRLDAAETAVSDLHARHERYRKVSETIDAIRTKNQALAERYAIYGTLSDVASGKNAQRISLHRFVLGVLLDDVLIQASYRMRKMSKGRYNLLRKIERSKGNAGSGLELLVEDGYTGKSRDVATLSGGESFIAALSLALGLSDVVQSYSGGIRLDTLFIDEGFGSLDSEALDLAIQTLLELQQNGRTIGIISHVSELKEQMQTRIDVAPSPAGSHLTLSV